MPSLNNVNWVDLLIVLLLGRVVYIGIKKGFAVEAFKCIGVLSAAFFTLHYYSAFSKALEGRIPVPPANVDIVSYVFLWAFVIFAFKLIRNGVEVLFKMQAHPMLDMWGGLVLSVGRGFLLCSMTVLLLRLSGIGDFKKTTEASLSGSRLVVVAPKIYESIYNGFISKFFPSESLNTAAIISKEK